MENPRIKLFPKWYKTYSRGMSLFPFGIFVKRKDYPDYEKLVNHELIHWQQQKEMFKLGIIISFLLLTIIYSLNGCALWNLVLLLFPFLFFYIWYVIEWLINIPKYKNIAYVNLSHEQEAYDNDQDLDYLEKRKRFAWLKYLKYKPVK